MKRQNRQFMKFKGISLLKFPELQHMIPTHSWLDMEHRAGSLVWCFVTNISSLINSKAEEYVVNVFPSESLRYGRGRKIIASHTGRCFVSQPVFFFLSKVTREQPTEPYFRGRPCKLKLCWLHCKYGWFCEIACPKVPSLQVRFLFLRQDPLWGYFSHLWS